MSQKISYAQNFEDVMLWRALGHVEGGRYIDIGAQSPLVDSVSKLFYEQGWRGMHVDASAKYAEELRSARPDEMVVQAAVAAEGGMLQFFELPGTGLSTLFGEVAAQHAKLDFNVVETNVPAVTLCDLFGLVGEGPVHWLKIDVEGGEKGVLAGWKDSAVRPWVVVVESTLPMTRKEAYAGWEPLLIERGYRFVYFDGLNRFYLASGHEDLETAFSLGPNVFDGIALSGTATSCFSSEWQAQLETIELEHAQGLETQKAEFDKAMRKLEGRRQDDVASFNILRADFTRQRERLEDQLKESRLHSDWVVRDSTMARVRLDEQAEAVNRWQSESIRLQHQIDMIHLSASWRATAPLRLAGRALRLGMRIPSSALRFAKRLARSIVVRAMAFGMRHARLRRLVVSVLGRFPSLDARFRRLATSGRLINQPPALGYTSTVRRASGEGAAGESANVLSRTGERMYRDIQRETNGRES
jgi:FkbM family methyltransferase